MTSSAPPTMAASELSEASNASRNRLKSRVSSLLRIAAISSASAWPTCFPIVADCKARFDAAGECRRMATGACTFCTLVKL